MMQQQQQHSSSMNDQGLPSEKKQRVAGGYNPTGTSNYDYQVSRHRIEPFMHVSICLSREIPINRRNSINSNVFSLCLWLYIFYLFPSIFFVKSELYTLILSSSSVRLLLNLENPCQRNASIDPSVLLIETIELKKSRENFSCLIHSRPERTSASASFEHRRSSLHSSEQKLDIHIVHVEQIRWMERSRCASGRRCENGCRHVHGRPVDLLVV